MAWHTGPGIVREADFRLHWREKLDVLSASDRVEILIGYSQEDFLSGTISFETLLHPKDAPWVRQLFAAEAAEAGESTVRVRHADRRIRCLRWRYERETGPEGEPIVQVQLRDPAVGEPGTTDSDQAADLKAVMGTAGDELACVKDRNHVIKAASESFARMFSDAAGAVRNLVGLTDYDLYPEEYADRTFALEEGVLGGEPMARIRQERLDERGQREWLTDRKFPVRGRNGEIIGLFTVICGATESAPTEHALRESEQSLEEVQRIGKIGSFVLNVAERTWTGSDMLYELLGLEKNTERSLSDWTRLVFPDDLAVLGRLYGEIVVDRGKILDYEMRFIRQTDGAERWAHLRARLERNAKGKPRRVRGTIEDITDRKISERELRKSAALLELFIQDSPTGLAMLDREMRYISASRRWLEDHGLEEGKIVGRSHFDLGYQVPKRWRDQYRRGLEGETTPFSEDSYKSHDGSTRWVRRMVCPWLQGDGSVGGIVVLAEDITGRKLAEAALRASEQSLKEAQKIARVGSYVLDLASGIWTSSEALDEIFGIDADYRRTVDGWNRLVHPDDQEMMASHLSDEVLGKAMDFSKEYRIVRPRDHAVRWLHGLGKLENDASGKAVTLRGTIQDITERKQADASLRESRELMQVFIEHSPAAIAMFDCEMRYIAASRRWTEGYKLQRQDFVGRSHYDVFPDIPEHWKAAHRRGMAGEQIRMEEDRFDRADGTTQWLRWEIVPWRAHDGSIGGIIIFVEDTSEQRASKERLQLAANVFTHASEGILITDVDGKILDSNEAFSRITGYGRAEVLGRNPRLLQSGRQTREFYEDMWTSLKREGHWSGEIWNRAKAGQIYAENLTISAVPDAAGKTKQYVAMFSDITSIKEKERQLRHVAHFDLLTGLPNRALLADRLRQGMAQSHRLGHMLAVAFLDLDNFREVNDLHGHMIGDQLLTAITQRMRSALREGDTLARLGGDEFVAVLLDLVDIEESLPLMTKLLTAAGEPVALGDLTLQLSASIGVTFYPQAEEVEPDQLLRQADQAMYYAKLAGRSRYHIFDPKLDRTMRGRHEDLRRIRVGLEAKEFELYFQPRVNMCTGAILGAEALIRWNHPEQGLLTPGQFLPILDGNALVVELGDWVLRTALEQMEEWHKEGLNIPVSVNVDAMQLQESQFVNKLRELFAEHPGISPSRLEMEVLESSALQDVAQVSEVIRTCNRLGISFALDDFGTGYSSLAYLKRLPVDVLKIDQTFVHDMLDDPEDLTILEGILGLARSFRRQAVAEGVETVEHGLMLLRLGCQLAQGHGIARPMRGGEMPDWAAEWRPDPRWANVSSLDPANWALLYASVEHRAWVAEIEEFVLGHRQIFPSMDHHACRFGSWLDAEVAAGRGERAGFQTMDALHQRLHNFANEIFDLKKMHQEKAALAGLTELHGLRDGMLDRLQYFVQSH
ncbi:MAG TPA: EAL domain-containing protein [Terracidiphilus sp.]|nr:EAL domain-containing protein [Terracidiphilus sp.]